MQRQVSGRWFMAWSHAFCMSVCFTLCTGCGGGASGPVRHPVAGVVTYAGKPVPAGEILFVAQSGPGAMLEIAEGEFRSARGQGVPAGDYKVRISGRTAGDGGALSESKPLFKEYEGTATVKPGDNSLEFNIPELIPK